MRFKNQIRHMAAVVGNTLLKTFPEVFHHSLGQLRRNGVDFLLDPFLQILKRSRTMFENLFLQVSPKEKSHTGLNLVTVPATQRLPLKRSNTQGTFPSTLGANFVLCKLWPHPVETTHLLYPHCPVWGAERSPAFQHTGRKSQLLLHHLPQKSRGRSHQSRQLHTKQLHEESEAVILGVYDV